jgi:DNA-binding NtrC family response regulator
LAAEQRPQVAIVDLNLKQETPCDLIDELHAQGVRVIVISAYKAPLASKDSVAAFLHKPVNGTELITTIHRIVSFPSHARRD